jgi:phosphoglycolate phosphatase
MASFDAVKAVLFDLDGTLIDSVPDIHAALNSLLAEEGLRPLSVPRVTGFVGHGVARLVDRAFAHLDRPLRGEALDAMVVRFSALYGAKAAVLTRPFPGVEPALAALHAQGIRLGVCTNKPAAITRSILKALGLAPRFDAVIGGDSTPERKPGPAPLLACLKALDAPAGRALYIGDSETDVLTARNAGLPVILVSYGYTGIPAAALGADLVIDRLDHWVSALDS